MATDRSAASTREEVGALVYDVLARYCDAPDDSLNRCSWDGWWNNDNRAATEYRFMGALGFGGKFWRAHGKWYVNCYREDETQERRSMIDRANAALEELHEQHA